jgi:nucleoside-diphosphate-sugar epimerase
MKLPADKIAKLRPAFDGLRVCVTGGAGFIGGHLCDALMSLGALVNVVDDLSNSTLEHLSGLIELEPDRVRFFHASILDDDALQEATQGCRVIFHLGALGSVPRSVKEPQRTLSVNTTGTARVLEAARKHAVRRVVFAASSSAYGDQPELPKVETQYPRPLSPYAASKLAGEFLLSAWSRTYGLETVGLRYFNVFGPRQSTDSAYAAVVAAFTRNVLNNEPPVIFGDGTQTRDMTFVANAVYATLLAGSVAGPFAGEIMNIGTGRRVSIVEIAQAVVRRLGSPHVQPIFRPARTGDVMHSLADIGKAERLLGYQPLVNFEDGLAETVEWYKRATADSI